MERDLTEEEVAERVNMIRMVQGCTCHPDIFVAAMPFGGHVIQLDHEPACHALLRANWKWN